MVGDEQAVALGSEAAAAMSRPPHAPGEHRQAPANALTSRRSVRLATPRSRVDPPIPIQRRCRYDRDGTCHW
jgi:hypothetical protein